jgi:hypothetical protein
MVEEGHLICPISARFFIFFNDCNGFPRDDCIKGGLTFIVAGLIGVA